MAEETASAPVGAPAEPAAAASVTPWGVTMARWTLLGLAALGTMWVLDRILPAGNQNGR